MQGGASALRSLAGAHIRGSHERRRCYCGSEGCMRIPCSGAVSEVSPCEGDPVRSVLVPFLAPASEAPTKGDAAIADVEAVRRSRGSASAASESAPGAVPGRHELLSGAMPEDACMAQHVSLPLHLCRSLLTTASAHTGFAGYYARSCGHVDGCGTLYTGPVLIADTSAVKKCSYPIPYDSTPRIHFCWSSVQTLGLITRGLDQNFGICLHVESGEIAGLAAVS